ncbi:MAG: GxxExxY protein, partial [Deltaproteobacteria bacterium]
LTNDHYAQTINYLEAHRTVEIALLINFGEKSLRWKRFIKTKEGV